MNIIHQTRSALSNAPSPLSMDALLRIAPSVAAAQPHEGMSHRYAYIPTLEVIKGLVNEGFTPFSAQQKLCRDEGKAPFTKHVIRLRHGDYMGNQEANELVLINSHDGSSSYELIAGVFRMVCANGLIVGNSFESFKVRHSGDVREQVIDAAFKVVDSFKMIDAHRDAMKAKLMPRDRQLVFAMQASRLRWPDPETPAPISADKLLEARRSYDTAGDLWTVFNRVQENLMRGGQRYIQRRGEAGQFKRGTTRAINGINQGVSINRGLWNIAEQHLEGAAIAA